MSDDAPNGAPNGAPIGPLARALALAEENGLIMDDPMPVSESDIAALEAEAGAPLPASFRACVATWGALTLDGMEVYGLIPGRLDAQAVPNLLWLLRDMREREGLPRDLLPVMDLDDGVMACLDLSAAAGGEAPVVERDIGAPDRRDRLADSFGDYLLQRVQDLID